jgi:hypothetical protein
MPAIKFCGASVVSFNSRLGWGDNKSALDIDLIEDARNGDFFNPPAIGTPCYFYFTPSFHFWGILQHWVKSSSAKGLNLYKVTVEDPRDLLAGVSVILGNYNGSTYNVQNILNCFGYWENTLGFGGADVNASGMLWTKVLEGIQLLTNQPINSMGGPVHFRGVDYAVDLSNLPIPPAYYRIGAGQAQMYLLDIITEVCRDGGCDFFVELDPGVVVPIIRIYTVSRYSQPPLGTIAAITNQNWGGIVVSADNGVELRNESTAKFLIGGQQSTLYETNSIQPFWGNDINGIPVDDMIVNIPLLGYCHAAIIDATEVAGCFNDSSTTYFLTEFEMRAAMTSIEAWQMYVNYETFALDNKKATNIGPLGIMGRLAPPKNANKQVKVMADFVKAINAQGNVEAQQFQQNTLYEFVKGRASEWYGKQFLVSLPFMLQYAESETNVIVNSNTVSQGGWVAEGTTPFNLALENVIRFVSQDMRYVGMALYGLDGVDLAKIDQQSSAVQADAIYTPLSVEETIYNLSSGVPAVLVTINNPVPALQLNIAGDFGMLGIMLNQIADGVWEAIQGNRAWGVLDVRIIPPMLFPMFVGIPLDSKVSTYGPWYFAGPAGKVTVEQNTDLTPWKCGNTNMMNLTANAQVTSAVTYMQIGETGKLELVGTQLTSLGQTLMADGPSCTNIEVHIGREGITTTYQFKRFTDLQLHRFMSGYRERLQRLVDAQLDMKRTLLAEISRASSLQQRYFKTKASEIKRLPKWQVAGASPDPVIISSAILDQGKVRTHSALCDTDEGWTGIGGSPRNNQDAFQNSALCSVSAIMRAFDNNPNGVSKYLPKVEKPDPSIVGIGILTLNPFNASTYNDFEYLSTGTTPANGGYVIANDDIDWDNVRGICLTAPVMLAGWGMDIFGNFVPTPLSPDKYKVGPLDVLWDSNRKVWSVHDSMFGTLVTDCTANGTAQMNIMGTNNLRITVHNLFSALVKANTKVCVNYQPYLNQWAIIAADCTQ